MTVSFTVPETEPEKITAGDTIAWKKYLSDFLPSDGWVLTYALVKDGQLIEITATNDGEYHYVEVAAATTVDWDPGSYDFQAYVTKAATSERKSEIITGKLEILTNFALQSSGFDARSHFKKTLDYLEATIEGKATTDQLSYSIDGRSLSRMGIDELLMWRDKYTTFYNNEERRAGRKSRQIIRVKF